MHSLGSTVAHARAAQPVSHTDMSVGGPGLKRGLNVIDDAMRQLAGTSAEGLSRADVIALAAAEAVRMTGGPAIRVPVGKLSSGLAESLSCLSAPLEVAWL